MAHKTESGDETRLPKWAQGKLTELRNRITELESALTVARGLAPAKGATGKVIADLYINDGFPLHDRALIKFQVGPRKHDTITCCLRNRGDQTVLDVNAQSGRLVIHPHAANCADLLVGD